MKVKKLKNENIHIWIADVIRIGNEAVMKAKEENKKLGIPEFFYKNGKIYYILESGEITTEKPEIFKN
ncbi:MAG TPA: hypothetical protein ENJ95_21790, partial [Bacteroidetes bacterium]|nr:hypothetical protein [Bacteroidota bacterium]